MHSYFAQLFSSFLANKNRSKNMCIFSGFCLICLSFSAEKKNEKSKDVPPTETISKPVMDINLQYWAKEKVFIYFLQNFCGKIKSSQVLLRISVNLNLSLAMFMKIKKIRKMGNFLFYFTDFKPIA